MCTAMTLKSQTMEQCFGRTMDFSHDIDPSLYIIPSHYKWHSLLNNQPFEDSYRFIGLGQEMQGMLGFFDGVNEKGFAAAVLYFAGYAQYNTDPIPKNQTPVASIDFLHYMLGRCACVKDVFRLLPTISIVGIPDPITNSIAPLHWMVTDRNGDCAVIEPVNGKLEFLENSIGIMANSPTFPWHMTNLRNYMGATPTQTPEVYWNHIKLTPFGQAHGTFPLPGGFTSPERFVRAAYLKSHLPVPKDRRETIISCFHVMENVSIPKGAVISGNNTYDYTKYTAFMNTHTCEYFYKTYGDFTIHRASLWDD